VGGSEDVHQAAAAGLGAAGAGGLVAQPDLTDYPCDAQPIGSNGMITAHARTLCMNGRRF